MTAKRDKNPTYCFIDIDLKTRQIVGRGRGAEGHRRGASDERLSPRVF